MKKLNLFGVSLAISLSLFGITVAAADLGEAQLVAAEVCGDNVIGPCRVNTRPTRMYCLPDGSACVLVNTEPLYQVNCLVGLGASMRQYDDDGDGKIDASDPFDPTAITYFGRTTCNRPVPNLNDNPQGAGVSFTIGSGVPIQMKGQAFLNYFDPSNPSSQQPVNLSNDVRNVLAGAYSEVGEDNWGLSRGYYYRSFASPNLTNSFTITHNVRLELPSNWVWISLPPSCTGNLRSVATCRQESVPFQVGLNPGEPQGQP